MARWLVPVLLLSSTLAACSSSSSTSGTPGTDASLPDTFGDCGAAQCNVSLAAFTSGHNAYCTSDRASFDVSCSSQPGLQTATCGELWTARVVYGFPGDYYQCTYDAGGTLVGAKWAPDSHPVQLAGTQPPPSCAFAAQCGDAGTD